MTGPAPREARPRPDLGRRRKGAPGSDGCRLARLARRWRADAARSQPRRACGGRSVVAAPRHEAALRPDPSGSHDGRRSSPRGFVFRQARGCVSFRPCAAHGRAGIRGRRFARGTSSGRPNARHRPLADTRRGAGALGERRGRRIRRRHGPGAISSLLDRIPAEREVHADPDPKGHASDERRSRDRSSAG